MAPRTTARRIDCDGLREQPKTDMPYGTIGKLKISRLILGSNLMGGYSHSRDLSYVGPLMQAYNTEEKIMETLALAEAEGINTISQGDSNLIQKYNDQYGGHMQQLGPLNIREGDDDEKHRDVDQAAGRYRSCRHLHLRSRQRSVGASRSR